MNRKCQDCPHKLGCLVIRGPKHIRCRRNFDECYEIHKKAKSDAASAYFYALNVIKDRWPEGEDIIRTDPRWAYHYAAVIIRGRWPEGEDIIKIYPQFACYYAINVIGGRWPEAEDIIKTDDEWLYHYNQGVIKEKV